MGTISSPQAGRAEKIGVIIPVYGEKETILTVLDKMKGPPVDTICLVVDVPLKSVMAKVRVASEQIGATVHIIKNRRRSGVGFGLRQGLEYLLETGHTIAVIMAGNGKDDPREMPKLIEPVLARRFDYVQGSRYLEGGYREKMPLVRQVFNRLYPALWTLITDRECTDVTNGYRCYRLALLDDRRINLYQGWLNGYSLEYYLHYKVLALGYRMSEVPVSKIYPYGHKGGYSKIQPLKDWWPIISPLVLLFLGVRQ
jgi:dolichol-phosphate mannosyltransferase